MTWKAQWQPIMLLPLCPGEFDERVFCGLDFVLAEAARRDLKVMLVLINYWKVGMAREYTCGRCRVRSRCRNQV